MAISAIYLCFTKSLTDLHPAVDLQPLRNRDQKLALHTYSQSLETLFNTHMSWPTNDDTNGDTVIGPALDDRTGELQTHYLYDSTNTFKG
jgi:hypothetical protein